MSNGFHYSETSAFTPVPYDVYGCGINPSNTSSNMDGEVIMPLCEFENRGYTTQPFVDQWVANLHQQPAYEPGLSFSLLAYPYIHECLGGEPGFIRKRNERERMRVRNVNEGYAVLRDHLPIEPTEKRLSKVETLRGAIKYIKLLEKMLKESDKEQKKKETKESPDAVVVDLNNNNVVQNTTDNNNNKGKNVDNIVKKEKVENNKNLKDLNNNCMQSNIIEKSQEKNFNVAASKENKSQITSKGITTTIVNTKTTNTKTFKDTSFYAKNNIELDENNNLVYRYKDSVEDDYTNINTTSLTTTRKRKMAVSECFDEVASSNIAKSFELLSKELMYNEPYSQKAGGTDSDDSSTYIDIEKA